MLKFQRTQEVRLVYHVIGFSLSGFCVLCFVAQFSLVAVVVLRAHRLGP